MAVPARRPVAFALRGRIERAELPALAEQIRLLLEGTSGGNAVCDVSEVHTDAVVIDALARLDLVGRRSRCSVRVRGASQELLELLALVGLADVLMVDR